MKKLTPLFIGAALAAGAATQTFTGVITDTMCGKDHAMMKVTPVARCVVECVKHDKNNKYALFDGKNLYILSDQKTPAKYAAQKVKVSGTYDAKSNTIKVASIEGIDGEK